MEKSLAKNLPKCRICYKRHTLKDCSAFYNMDVLKRRQEVKIKGFCFKCLCSSHTREWCRSRKTCMVCNNNHHTMLHVDDHNKPHHSSQVRTSKVSPSSQRQTTHRLHSTANHKRHRSAPLVHERLSQTTKSHVFLPTALARVLTSKGPAKLRLMLNSAGLQTFVNKTLVQRLHLRTTKKNGDEYCTLSLQSYHDPTVKIQITGLVQNRITTTLPQETNDKKFQTIYNHLSDLADPHFYKPTNVEAVIGNDQLPMILKAGLIQTSSTMPIAQSTIFGWVISGVCRC
ncbi:uncharacterized protein LOC142241354 [Haematobia irritans]|uniref:uncharacterized protein LOC142241354 n=1 Tax=Haematobia irritans TaxID=7368 RepID=UPI003F4FC195